MTEPHSQDRQEETSLVPASFEKRTGAWMGLSYALIFLFVMAYSIYSGGKTLNGTFPLLVIPVAAAALVIAAYRQRRGRAYGGWAMTAIIIVISSFAIIFCLLTGIPPLITALRG